MSSWSPLSCVLGGPARRAPVTPRKVVKAPAKVRKKRPTRLEREVAKLLAESQGDKMALADLQLRLKRAEFDLRQLVRLCVNTPEGREAIMVLAGMMGDLAGAWSEASGSTVSGFLAGRVGGLRLVVLTEDCAACAQRPEGHASEGEVLLLLDRLALKDALDLPSGTRVQITAMGRVALPGVMTGRSVLRVTVAVAPPERR